MENRWRAQRYGISEGLIDFGKREIIPFAELVDEMIELTQEDSAFLDCTAEMENAQTLVENGNSAEHQRHVFQNSIAKGNDNAEAMRDAVRLLAEEFHADL